MKRQCKSSYTMVWLLLELQVLQLTLAFLQEPNQCLAPPPCTCSSRVVNCNFKSLPTIPSFNVPDSSYSIGSSFSIQLMGNDFTTVPAYTFIIFSNATRVHLDLGTNNISYIAPDAFNGIENSLSSLQLSNNKLSSIPTAISTLNALETFLISNNPIKTLDPVVFSHLGHTLTDLEITMYNFNEWPTELHLLRKLKSLNVDGGVKFLHGIDHLFNGFESTLLSLLMDNTFKTIPNAVCHLKNLQTLTFINNLTLIEPFLQTCILTKVTTLTLVDSKLAHFPDVFKKFPSLLHLQLQLNQLQALPSEIIPLSYNLTYLDLQRNKFYRVPYAINLFKSLSSLILSNNSIHSVEDNDFTDLDSLTSLDLSNNPIIYISTGAFKHTTFLSSLDLRGTLLKQIPAAISNIQQLKAFYLDDFKIECTCNLAYLRHWNVQHIWSWNPTCEYNTETVTEYISQSLQQCP